MNFHLLMLLLVCVTLAFNTRSTDGRAAGPAAEDALRMEVCLNGVWEAAPGGDRMPENGWEETRVPALPLTDDDRPVGMWYRTTLDVPAEWAHPGRRFFVELEKVGHYAGLYVNGQLVDEHHSQFAPFKADVTDALRPGQRNEMAVHVHAALGRYARPEGAVEDELTGCAYRPAARNVERRNWVGIVGDVTLSWRPENGIEDVFVVPSVRQSMLGAEVSLAGRGEHTGGLSCRTVVLDGHEEVLTLDEHAPGPEGTVLLQAPWSDPVLWGPPPYGVPKLYTLRTELLRDGRVIDRSFTRFGFREVWVDGEDVLLNGKKLWLVGTYMPWLWPTRYLNDRHAIRQEVRAMQTAGLNATHGHWDDLGRTYMDVCDEQGMLVFGGYYCNGQLNVQPQADDGWPEWMVRAGGEWARARRNHPSIVMWRPLCGLPKNLQSAQSQRVRRAVREHLRACDNTRPVADRSDVWDYSQGAVDPETGKADDGARLARVLAEIDKPVLTNEIWFSTRNMDELVKFFRAYYATSYEGGATGMVPQHVMAHDSPEHDVRWLSLSGRGNRDASWVVRDRVVNWCDPSQPAWTLNRLGKVFAELHAEHLGRGPEPCDAPGPAELLVSGARPGEPAFLLSAEPDAPAVGVRAAPDGTAWFTGVSPGDYRLVSERRVAHVTLEPGPAAPKPGYGHVQRLTVE